MVDAVVHHWLTGIIADAEAQGELGQEGRHQVELFYADDGMVASSDPRWLHGAFNTLVRLTGVTDHADCLPDICLQAHPVKQANQGVKCAL